MLKKFTVENVKGFKNIEFDLSNTRDYSFNKKQVKNGIINKGVIYGKNGSGKSNLGLAIHDIVYHLTDTKMNDFKYTSNYLNLSTNKTEAVFKYTFLFDNKNYCYEYKKRSFNELVFEQLSIENKIVLKYDYKNKEDIINEIKGTETLRLDLMDNKISLLKYIYKNTPNDNDSPISKIITFVSGMLWFRCLMEGNSFIGAIPNYNTLDDIVIRNDKVNEFQKFLLKNGLDFQLEIGQINGLKVLMARFGNTITPFASIISTGTNALWLYFAWSISFDKITFLFLDEFDAFYHYETSELIFNEINNNENIQSFVTTHNTYLMKNSFTRPDTCLIISGDKIDSLSNCTQKEIREAHNLEKLYINDAFKE